MGLNLKSQEAHQLAHDLASLTGESMTTAAIIAMRERLERIRKERDRETFIAESMAIAHDIAKRLGKRFSDLDPDKMLYDEKGLPK